jgi:mercuric ion binding protein
MTSHHRSIGAALFGALVLLLSYTEARSEGAPPATPSPPTSASPAQAGVVEGVFEVQGMHCAVCPVTVKKAAEGVVGVKEVKVSMKEGLARVTYDPAKTTPAAIAEAITKAGYPARPHG